MPGLSRSTTTCSGEPATAHVVAPARPADAAWSWPRAAKSSPLAFSAASATWPSASPTDACSSPIRQVVGGRARRSTSANVPDRSLRRPGRPDHHRIERIEVHPRRIGREDGHHLRARQLREVVGAVHGRSRVGVVVAGDQHDPDPRSRKARQLRDGTLHGPARRGVGVEQVAGDQDHVHALGQREVHGRAEGRVLALAQGGRRLAKVLVARARVHVRRVQQPEHAPRRLPLCACRRRVAAPAPSCAAGRPGPACGRSLVRAHRSTARAVTSGRDWASRPRDPAAIRAPPSLPVAPPNLRGHCDRSSVTSRGVRLRANRGRAGSPHGSASQPRDVATNA